MRQHALSRPVVPAPKSFVVSSFIKQCISYDGLLQINIYYASAETLGYAASLCCFQTDACLDDTQALRKHGVERYMPKEGEAFNHDMHNAMFDVPLPPNSEDTGPGSIAMLIKVRLAAKIGHTTAGDGIWDVKC